jgi:tight adherence protein B
MNIFIVALLIFIVSVIVIESVLYVFRSTRNPDVHKIRKKLRTLASTEYGDDVPDIIKKRMLSEVPAFDRVLSMLPLVKRLDRLLQQANIQSPLGVFILLTLLLAFTGFIGTSFATKQPALSLMAGALLGGLPFLYVHLKKVRRIKKFEEQLPEGLDMIARALRAGHAFSSGMKLAADEMGDPLGTEFGETLDEINFGVSVSDALKHLVRRVDCPDLNYFAVAVIVQRETGGNLAEIMENIAHVIRERFKLRGKVRVLSAEGKMSAKILVGLPFVITIAFRFMNPDYMNTLFTDPAGRIAVGIGVCMMVVGIIVMKRMVNITV